MWGTDKVQLINSLRVNYKSLSDTSPSSLHCTRREADRSPQPSPVSLSVCVHIYKSSLANSSPPVVLKHCIQLWVSLIEEVTSSPFPKNNDSRPCSGLKSFYPQKILSALRNESFKNCGPIFNCLQHHSNGSEHCHVF